MGRSGLVAGTAAAALALCLGGCAESGSPEPAAPTPVSTSVTLAPEQRENLRIVERLAELGCDTNSCIQTYFACKDGYLTGEACEFYRRNPL